MGPKIYILRGSTYAGNSIDHIKRCATLEVWVLYCWDNRYEIKWLDGTIGIWRVVKGVKEALPKVVCNLEIVKAGERSLIITWVKIIENPNTKREEVEFWCAKIEMRKANGEMWGQVVWSEKVLSLPEWLTSDRDSLFYRCNPVSLFVCNL